MAIFFPIVAQIVAFGAIMKTLRLTQKLLLLLLGRLLEKFGLLFVLTSGHTDDGTRRLDDIR